MRDLYTGSLRSRRCHESAAPFPRDIFKRISDIIFPVYFCNMPERETRRGCEGAAADGEEEKERGTEREGETSE